MQIVRAVPGDVLQLATVHVLSWQSAYLELLPGSLLDGLHPAQRVPGWTRIIERAQWPAEVVLVAEHDDEILGFAHVCPTRDNDQDSSTVAELTSLYVKPDAWRGGIGRQLMASSTQTMITAGYRSATLWVLDGNQRAITFYEATGWVADGATKHDTLGGTPVTEVRFRQSLVSTD